MNTIQQEAERRYLVNPRYFPDKKKSAQSIFTEGAEFVITNPAPHGLVTLEDALKFAEWTFNCGIAPDGKGNWFNVFAKDSNYTPSQIWEIFKQGK